MEVGLELDDELDEELEPEDELNSLAAFDSLDELELDDELLLLLLELLLLLFPLLPLLPLELSVVLLVSDELLFVVSLEFLLLLLLVFSEV